MASIFDDLGQMFSMDDKTSRQGFTNLFKDDPNSGFLDTMAREAEMKRKAREEAMAKSNIAAGGINPDNSFNAFQGTFPGNVNQAVVGKPDLGGVDFSQMRNVNTAMPRVPQDPGMSLSQAYDTYGLTGMAKGLFGFGQKDNTGIISYDENKKPIYGPLSQIPGAEGASNTYNSNIMDTRQGLLNALPDGLKERYTQFSEGFDNLSQEDALAMVDAFEKMTTQEPAKFSAVKMASPTTGYRIPIENLYNRGLLKI